MSVQAKVLIAVGILVAGGAIGWLVRGGGGQSADPLHASAPRQPPPEYLYLDSARVSAYLGQIDAGVAVHEKRALQVTNQAGGKLGVQGLELSGSTQRVGSIEQDVTEAATDRFYRLLSILIGSKWLVTVDTHLTSHNTEQAVLRQLARVNVGDFVRLTQGQAYLAPYAAVYPRALYTQSYLGGDLSKPLHPLFAPLSAKLQHAAHRYRTMVGRDPRLSLVVPTLTVNRATSQPIRFIVPVRYAGLGSEPSALAGQVTVVGKVLYSDLRYAKDVPRRDPNPPHWIDAQSLHDFTPALQHADLGLLRLLGFNPRRRWAIAAAVRRSVTFGAPVVVVLPIAIYE